MPQLPVRSSISRSATATLCSAVRAWPCSSMVSATTAAPCSRDDRHDPREPRLRAVAVLVVDRVDDGRGRRGSSRPASITAGSVESSIERQRGGGGAAGGDLAHVGDAVAADVVDAQVEQVRAVADLRRGRSRRSRPSRRRASRRGTPWSRWRWCARRSPGTTCPAGTARAGTARRRRGSGRGSPRGDRRGRRPARRPGRMCSGVVPQQPPTSAKPELADEGVVRVGQLVRGQRVVGAVGGRASGRPAFGMQDSPTRACLATGSAGARSSRPGRWRS